MLYLKSICVLFIFIYFNITQKTYLGLVETLVYSPYCWKPYLVHSYSEACPFFLLNQLELTVTAASWSVDTNTQTPASSTGIDLKAPDFSVRGEFSMRHHGPYSSAINVRSVTHVKSH